MVDWYRGYQIRAIPSYLVQEFVQPRSSGLAKWGYSSFYKKSVSLKFLLLFFCNTFTVRSACWHFISLCFWHVFTRSKKSFLFLDYTTVLLSNFWICKKVRQVHFLNFKVGYPESDRVACPVNQTVQRISDHWKQQVIWKHEIFLRIFWPVWEICPPTQTPTQKLKSVFSQEICSNLVSKEMIFEAL